MEENNQDIARPNAGGEQTSFGGQLGTTDDKTTASGEGGVADRVKSVASSVRGKAAAIPSMLADGLQAGAEALRQRRGSTTGSEGTALAITNDPSIVAVTDTLATGMQSSADWLRDADLEKLKQGVEKQVKEHPARSLLVALGAGYLIGKALRR
jgi:hypothetical protein